MGLAVFTAGVLALGPSACIDTQELREHFDPCAGNACQQQGPACADFTWILELNTCFDSMLAPGDSCAGIVEVVPDLAASPPHVRLRIGEKTVVGLVEINWGPPGASCAYESPGKQVTFRTGNPEVASIRRSGALAIVSAESVGETNVLIENAQTPHGLVSSPLAYCVQYVSCKPVELLLLVVP